MDDNGADGEKEPTDPFRTFCQPAAPHSGFILATFLPKTTLPAPFYAFYSLFLGSFCQNEPNSYFAQPIHDEIHA
jgi:hypothetical protein